MTDNILCGRGVKAPPGVSVAFRMSCYIQTGARLRSVESVIFFIESANCCGRTSLLYGLCVGQGGEALGEWTGWKLLTMAGLFDCWTPPGGGEPLYTYSVITVSASLNLESIHDR